MKLFLLVFLSFVFLPATAQSTMTGTVLNLGSGKPIEGITVFIKRHNRVLHNHATLTDSIGNYRLKEVMKGDSLYFVGIITSQALVVDAEDSLIIRLSLRRSEWDCFDTPVTIISDWNGTKRTIRRAKKHDRHVQREVKQDERQIRRHQPVDISGWVRLQTSDTAELKPVRGSFVTSKRTGYRAITDSMGFFILHDIIVGRDTVIVTGYHHEHFIMPVNKQFLEITVKPEIHADLYIVKTSNCFSPLTKKQRRQIHRKNERHFQKYLDGVI